VTAQRELLAIDDDRLQPDERAQLLHLPAQLGARIVQRGERSAAVVTTATAPTAGAT